MPSLRSAPKLKTSSPTNTDTLPDFGLSQIEMKLLAGLSILLTAGLSLLLL